MKMGNRGNRSLWAAAILAGAGVTAVAVSCGGGGGGGGTTIAGNMSGSQAFLPGPPPETRLAWTERLSLIGVAWAQSSGVQVCLADSDICTVTDETGAFVLPVDGDLVAPVCLELTGSSFSASFCLPFDIPNGSRVRISNIECDPGTDSCQAEDVDVDEAGDPSEPSDVSDEDFPSEPSDAEGPSEPSEPSQPDDPSGDSSSDPSEAD